MFPTIVPEDDRAGRPRELVLLKFSRFRNSEADDVTIAWSALGKFANEKMWVPNSPVLTLLVAKVSSVEKTTSASTVHECTPNVHIDE